MTNFTPATIAPSVLGRYAVAMTSVAAPLSGAGTAPTVILADDHDLVRDGLKLMVCAMLPGAQVLEAGNAPALWQLARRVPTPQLALVDLNMPGMERGLRLASLAREQPRLPLIVVSALTSPDVVRRALDVPSVCAFVPKSAGVARMREAIEAALQGRRLDPWLPDAAAAEATTARRPTVGVTDMGEFPFASQPGNTSRPLARKGPCGGGGGRQIVEAPGPGQRLARRAFENISQSSLQRLLDKRQQLLFC